MNDDQFFALKEGPTLNMHDFVSYVNLLKEFKIGPYSIEEEKKKEDKKFAEKAVADLLNPTRYIESELRDNMATLRDFTSHVTDNRTCSRQAYMILGKTPYGRSGNIFIELKNVLWIANQTQRTFIIPFWMEESLKSYDTTFLQAKFCAINEREYNSRRDWWGDVETIFTEHAFFAHDVWTSGWYVDFQKQLPPYDETILEKVEDHSLAVAAALLGNVQSNLVTVAAAVIAYLLGNSTSYMAIHHRNYEGSCGTNYRSEAFSLETSDVPVQYQDIVDWMGTSAGSKRLWTNFTSPFCTLPEDFVSGMCKLVNSSCNYVLYTSDGEANLTMVPDSYLSLDVIKDTVSKLKSSGVIPVDTKLDYVVLDILLLLHSGVFLMNPISTYSWFVELGRIVLQRQTTPTFHHVTNAAFYTLWMPVEYGMTPDRIEYQWKRFKEKVALSQSNSRRR